MVDSSNTHDLESMARYLHYDHFINRKVYTKRARDVFGKLEGDGRCLLKVLDGIRLGDLKKIRKNPGHAIR
jgi:hypothetical protein